MEETAESPLGGKCLTEDKKQQRIERFVWISVISCKLDKNCSNKTTIFSLYIFVQRKVTFFTERHF